MYLRHAHPRTARRLGATLIPGTLLMLFLSALNCDNPTNPFYVPADITYPDTLVMHVGEPIDTAVPDLALNVDIDSFTVSAALPDGLSLDTATGSITGTPLGPPGVVQCTLSAHNEFGVSNEVVVTLVVCPAAPTGLTGSAIGYAVSLAWDAVDGADSYTLYRLDTAGSSAAVVTTTDTGFLDTTDMDPAGSYAYFVVAGVTGTPGSWPSDTVAVSLAPVVVITSPGRDTTVATVQLTVHYSVDNSPFSRTVSLDEGMNEVVIDTLTADSLRGADTVYILVDTTGPGAPTVLGDTPTNDTTPTWTWISGGGTGEYRVSLNNPDISAMAETTTDLSYTPDTGLNEGPNTLYVQEQDSLGNWSSAGSHTIVVDITPPDTPIVSGPLVTGGLRPQWTWTSGGGGMGLYRYRLDNNTLDTAAVTSADTAFVPDSALGHGEHTLYVQERDSAGNWSGIGLHMVEVDTAAPRVTVLAPDLSGDSLVHASPVLGVSGTVSGSEAVAQVTATLNGSAVAVGLTGSQWDLTLDALDGTAWNEVVVTARDSLGRNGSYRFWVYGRFGLPVPGVPVIDESLCTQMTVSWHGVEHCSRYCLWRRGTVGSLTLVASDLTDTSYVDTGLATNTRYEYQVQGWYEEHTGSHLLRDTTVVSGATAGVTVHCFTTTLNIDGAIAMEASSDGGYLFSGNTGSSMSLLKTDSQGAQVFLAPDLSSQIPSFGESVYEMDDGYVVQATGNVPPVKIAKVSIGGDKLWERSYQMGEQGFANALAGAPDNGIMVLGRYGLLRLGTDGDSVWNKPLANMDPAIGLVDCEDGGYIVVGSSVTRVDSGGGFVWGRLGPGGSICSGVARRTSGGYLVWGHGGTMALSAAGDSVWFAPLPPEAGGKAVAGLAQMLNGDIIAVACEVTGTFTPMLVGYSSEGQLLWTRDLVPSIGEVRPNVLATRDGGLVFSAGNKLIKADRRGNTVP